MREQIISDIINASTKTQAIEAIRKVMKALHIGTTYEDLLGMQRDIKGATKVLRELEDRYINLPQPRTLEGLNPINIEAGFLRTKVVDELVGVINYLKVLLEESKTEERDKALQWLLSSPDHQHVTKSNARDYLGAAPNYKEWIQNYAIAYGNYKELGELLSAIDGFKDNLKTELYNIGKLIKEDTK